MTDSLYKLCSGCSYSLCWMDRNFYNECPMCGKEYEMTRKVLSKHKNFEDAKKEEARLIDNLEHPANSLQVRRKADGFEVVVRTS